MRGAYADGVVWPAPRPEADLVLVCFSYCGGGTTAFRPWIEALPNDVDLALVCLPGRERRITEPPAEAWDELMWHAVTAVKSVIRRPYVLFGHSMGGLIAFETTLHMQRSGVPPRSLIVSASTAPDRPCWLRPGTPTSRTGDEDLLTWMRDVGQLSPVVLADPDLRQLALDLFRADKRAAESYRFTAGTRVSCPLRELRGTDDPDVDPASSWASLAAGPYESHILPGGHFYTDAVWRRLPDQMRL